MRKCTGNFFFVFFFYLNFFLFKNIKKILTYTNDFCFNYQIKFFLKYQKNHMSKIYREKKQKIKKIKVFHQIANFNIQKKEYIYFKVCFYKIINFFFWKFFFFIFYIFLQ